MSDVAVGFCLSGGIGSSLTTALATEVAPGRIKTFTLIYWGASTTPGKEEDRRWARWVAEQYDTEHHEEVVEVADYPASLRKILRAFDEPFAGVVSSYFLAQRMAQHVKVAVAGDGADELFGSYRSHRIAAGLEDTSRNNRPDSSCRADLRVMSDRDKLQLYLPEVLQALADVSHHELMASAFKHLTDHAPTNTLRLA